MLNMASNKNETNHCRSQEVSEYEDWRIKQREDKRVIQTNKKE